MKNYRTATGFTGAKNDCEIRKDAAKGKRNFKLLDMSNSDGGS